MSEKRPFEMILLELRENIAIVTLNRSNSLNALNRRTLDELSEAFAEIQTNDGLNGAILTGTGEKAFAAGADIKELASLSAVEALQLSQQGHSLMDQIENLGKPVIAAVNGYALGGGCELAMACTIRIAAETAKFGQPEVGLGLIPGYGGTQRLPRLIGKGRALQMILTGKSIEASEALRIGLVNEVVLAPTLISHCIEIVKSIAANAPFAIRLALDAVNRGLNTSQTDGCAIEADLFAMCATTDDRNEGTSAFLQKRKPHFHGH
jgi:enoyl-CoA hydratase